MSNTMEYQGYIAAVQFDADAGLLRGVILNAGGHPADVFQAAEVAQLRPAFQRCVDEYLAQCRSDGVAPALPYYARLPGAPAPSVDNGGDGGSSGAAAGGGINPQPLTLFGRQVRLEPIGQQHAADLYDAGADPSIWRYLPRPPFADLDDARRWIDTCIYRNASEGRIQFAVISAAENRAVGSTGYLDIDRPNRALEIGMTWYGVPWQRTAVNTECKYLMLRHAFDDLGALRVCLKTDHRNERSQRAIERIGARREGVLRNHRIAWDGVNRHSVYYSIIASEWPAVRERLAARLT